MPKTLKQCLNHLGIESSDERIIEHITNDSRQGNEHSIYIGNKYKIDAQKKNAIILHEKYTRELINYFYDDPSQNYYVIAVTGTHGKTSVTHYLKQILTHLGYKCIRLGTHHNEFEDEIIESENTTMDLMNNLDIFMKYKNKIDVIIMEISSIAIEERRIDFISFDQIIYTNLSIDHLDYHQTFTQYMYSKFKLRKQLKENGKICLNMNDLHLRKLLELERMSIIPYSFNYEILDQDINQIQFKYENQIIHCHMFGEYVIKNLISAFICLKTMNIDINDYIDYIPHLKNVEGRMEVIHKNDKTIIIDYAHTSESLEMVCKYLNQFKKNHFICVFGCGGNRDRSKRIAMVRAASEYCDEVIICEDNNRDEKFEDIVQDMCLQEFSNVKVIEKRQDAIKFALVGAQKHDIILVAGKGNEKFLITGKMKIPFNDKEFIINMKEV